MPRNYSSSLLTSILADIQNGACSHSRCLDRLIELHFQDSERFKRDFAGHLNTILYVAGDKRGIDIEKLVHLVIDFAAGKTGTEEDSHYKRTQFSLFAIQHLASKTNVKDKAIRFRATQILTGVLQNLSNDIELEATLQEAITDKMIERARDKLPSVRCFAIASLSCFQMNHSVMEEFSRIMDSDTNKYSHTCVKLHWLTLEYPLTLPLTYSFDMAYISKHTIPSILRRTRDVKEDIRELAFEVLTKNVRHEKLTPRQRCELLNELLKENTPSEKEIIILKNWLAARFGNDIFQMCEMLDVENNEDLAEQALQKTLNVTSLASPITLTGSNVTAFTCFYWRIFCEHLKRRKLESDLDDALPSLSEYCDILRDAAMSKNASSFLLKQLLQGCVLFDTADEAGRAKLTSQLGSMLTTAPLEVVHLVTRSLFVVESEVTECIRLTVESISELMDPLEEDSEIKKLKDKLIALQSKSKGTESSKEKTKIEERLMDYEKKTWVRCCTITEQLLGNINKGLNNPMVAGLFHSVIIPSVKHKSPEIRHMGLKLLGLFCLFDKEMAISHVPIFIQAINRDNNEVKITSMRILFDFLLAYDFNNQAIQDSQQASPAGQSIQTLLRGYLNSPDEDLKATCVEGFAKLMLADVVLDNGILSQLIEQYYSPNTTSLPRLRQCLYVFLHTYLRTKQPNPNPRVRLFRKALFTALKTFIYSPSSLEIPLVEVSAYLLNLMRLGCGKSGSAEEETKLAVKIIKQLKADPNGMASPNLCKVLRLLRLENGKQDDLDFMIHTTRRILKSIEDKSVSTSLEKFLELVLTLSPTKIVASNQKPSEPASPSPPSSPYFTASPPLNEACDEVTDAASVAMPPPPDVKTPISRKERRANGDAKQLGDFIDKQKRAFAEVDGFSLEVEVTPKKPRPTYAPISASKIASTPTKSTPLRIPDVSRAPNTVPRVKPQNKQVKFGDVSYKSESKTNKRKHEVTNAPLDSKQQKTTKPPPQTEVSPKKSRYVLSFTGFKGEEKASVVDLQEKARKLNMTCYTDDAFDSTVTHVISPVGRKTVKTMTARLAGLWVVDPKWIIECDKASKIIPELKYPLFAKFWTYLDYPTYGTKQQNCLFDGKTFAFSPAFISSTPRSTLHNCKTFITLARGVIVDEFLSADYVLVPEDSEESCKQYPNNECLTNKQFFALLSV